MKTIFRVREVVMGDGFRRFHPEKLYAREDDEDINDNLAWSSMYHADLFSLEDANMVIETFIEGQQKKYQIAEVINHRYPEYLEGKV